MNTTKTELKFRSYKDIEKAFEENGPLPTFAVFMRGGIEIVSVLNIKAAWEEGDLFHDEEPKVEMEYCSSFDVRNRFFKNRVEMNDIKSIEPVLSPKSLERMVNLLKNKLEPVQAELDKLQNALDGAKVRLEKRRKEQADYVQLCLQ